MKISDFFKFLVIVSLLIGLFARVTVSSYQNWDDKELESYLSTNYRDKQTRIYLNAVRPYFIQRNLKNAAIFYDLNPRFGKDSVEISGLCFVVVCFMPNLMILNRHDLPNLTKFQKGKPLNIEYQGSINLVIEASSLNCANQSLNLDCDQLEMLR